MEKNFYEKFGLKEDASDVLIKKAYRKLALKYHPDKNNGDTNYDFIFKHINEIYDTLSNPIKRRAYDEILQTSGQDYSQNFASTFNSYNYSTTNSPKNNLSPYWKIPYEIKSIIFNILPWLIILSILWSGNWLCTRQSNNNHIESSDTNFQQGTGEMKFSDSAYILLPSLEKNNRVNEYPLPFKEENRKDNYPYQKSNQKKEKASNQSTGEINF